MIGEITTREQLADVLERRNGYLYNDFGGREPKMCPIHHVACNSLGRMLAVSPGRLTVRKVWSDSLPKLIAEVKARGKVYAFCGMEPDLSGAADRNPSGPAPRLMGTTPAPAAPTTTTPGAPRFLVAPAGDNRHVTVWSSYRLQFDSKPETQALKAAIGAVVARLRADDGEILEAVYTSEQRDLVDAENVLLYDVGTGRFAASARDGLRFERVYAAPAPAPATIAGAALHRHDYGIVPADSISSRLRRGATLLSVRDVPVPQLAAFSHLDGVWLAMRLRAPQVAATHTGRYGLDVNLHVSAHERAHPADIVKPLVDGLVTGLHEHDGSDIEHLSRSVAARVGIGADEVARLLCRNEGALFGRRRLLWKRAATHQWNPADDRCVTCTVRRRASARAEGWRVDVEVFRVAPSA